VSQWAAKRFWTTVTVVPEGDGYAIRLDARAVKTPLKQPLVVPTKTMAQAIADEWQAQTGAVNPETMPFTRSANSAIDKVATQFDEVVDMLAAYGGTDLLCYRAETPQPLIARQQAAWDPLLEWLHATHGARLRTTHGVVHVAQDPAALAILRAQVVAFTPFELTAFHDLVAISGSLVLALAVTAGRLSVDMAWQLSRIDEDWQISQWGEDDEAAALAATRHAAMQHAGRFYALCGSQS
jgi:chaperone required for assembly of F1-ATPase